MKDIREKLIEVLDAALNKPGRFRLRLIKWLFPEIIPVANTLRKYYWAEHCPWCGTTNIEEKDSDNGEAPNRHCNICNFFWDEDEENNEA